MGRSVLEKIIASARAGGSSDELLIDALLKYTGYSDTDPGQTLPNPFDDPYVGAALFDGNLKLLGCYRKKTAAERHSEPEAILDALRASGSPAALGVVEEIENHYAQKSWLEGEARKKEFEHIFAKAGIILRDVYNTDTLQLFSSLEPCGLYETQPSCADLIAVSQISRVVYASDDINPKGFGRPRLEKAKIPVVANVAPDQAIKLNNLFFATAEVCNKVYSRYDGRRLFSGPPYSIFRIDTKLFDHTRSKSGRLELLPYLPIEVSYVGPETKQVAPIITQREIDQLRSSAFDRNIALFYGGNSLAEVSKLLHYECRTGRPLPGTLVFTRNPVEDATTPRLNAVKEIISGPASTIRPHSFRKHDEFWEAARYVLLSEFRSELRDHFAVIVKKTLKPSKEMPPSPYASTFCDLRDAVAFVRDQAKVVNAIDGYVARISVLMGPRATEQVADFLDQIAPDLASGANLRKASVQVRLVIPPEAEKRADSEMDRLTQRTERFHYPSRLEILPALEVAAKLDLHALATDMMHGWRDPKFFGPEYLDGLARHPGWLERKNAGHIYARLVTANGDYAHHTFLSRLHELANEGVLEANWAECCTRLNALKDAAEHVVKAHHEAAVECLVKIGQAISKHNDKATRSPWLVDVIWRWLACWFRYSATDEAPTVPRDFEPKIAELISSDSFLLSEALHYAFRCERIASTEQFQRLVATDKVSEIAATSAAIRLARLMSGEIPTVSPRLYSHAKTWLRLVRELGSLGAFRKEYRRCQQSLKRGVIVLAQALQVNDHDTWRHAAPHDEGADDLRSYIGRRAISKLEQDLTVSQRILDSVGLAEQLKSWRSDYRVIVEDMVALMPARTMPWCLIQIAQDTDVSLRWAAIDIAFNSAVVSTALNAQHGEAANAIMREMRARVVDASRRIDSHYWVEREILRAFLELSAPDTQTPEPTADHIGRCPSAARLSLKEYLTCDLQALHPEVKPLAEQLRSRCKTVALILPPIAWSSDGAPSGRSEPNQGSPPLGLGQIATTLAAAGHVVELIDAHRFSTSRMELAEYCSTFDYIGISVVFSTISATFEFLTDLNRIVGHSGKPRPKIVLGGHAPTLNEDLFISSSAVFDYLIIGPGEVPLLNLVNDVEAGTKLEAVRVMGRTQARPISLARVRNNAGARYSEEWSRLPVLDRSVFLNAGQADGEPSWYEPAQTRSTKHTEAHVVMSRGCDWTCSFCTEAIVNGNAESRRSVSSVLREVRYLIAASATDRIQFIDDNLLPPLAAMRVGASGLKGRIEWSSRFLDGLAKIRATRTNGQDLKWRGLMRAEDFLAYLQEIPDFASRLRDAGCSLLAFGVEHGNSAARKQAKAGTQAVENNEFKNIVDTLRQNAIYSKGYFMLGGPNDSLEQSEETLRASKTMSFDLAYFAIYKNFRGIAVHASRNGPPNLDFRLFEFDLAKFVLSAPALQDWTEKFGLQYGSKQRNEFKKTFTALGKLGFDFRSLFKYNDFHLASSPVFGPANAEFAARYFQILRRAYLEFYGRPSWVKTYRQLLEIGY
jgi:radical SAM superfamily enzyme YgiQ (UPF0313 family)/pyrimidine deaminase RibD-like protein